MARAPRGLRRSSRSGPRDASASRQEAWETAAHYLRFARALALVGATATTAGCYQAHERPIDANLPDAGPIDAYVPDLPDAGPCARPLPCACPTLSTPGTCTEPYASCCPIVGPLAPPELPRFSGSW